MALIPVVLTAWLAASAIGGWTTAPVITLAAMAAVVALLGAMDDWLSLRARVRLPVHFAAALVVVVVVGGWSRMALPFAGPVDLGAVAPVLAILWLVGLLNAYNFMDGIDGIAGAQGLAAGAAWCAFGLAAHQPAVAWLGAATAAASLGFLTMNWHPARIFLGDAGSTGLGFLLAGLPLLAREAQPAALAPWLAACPVWPFVFDAGYTFLRRATRGENVFHPHRDHLYQRLVIAGWSHPRVAALYGVLAAVGGAVLLLVAPQPRLAAPAALLLLALAALLAIVTILVERRARAALPASRMAATAR